VDGGLVSINTPLAFVSPFLNTDTNISHSPILFDENLAYNPTTQTLTSVKINSEFIANPNGNLIFNSGGGNVGIGTTNPNRKLSIYENDVNGYALFNLQSNLQELLFGCENAGRSFIQAKTRQETPSRLQLNPAGGNIECYGYVGIGVSPTYSLHLNGDSAAKPSTNTWTISSDIRIKQNITTISKEELFNISKKFEPKRYKFKENYRKAHNIKDKSFVGIIADEVAEYMPCCVDKNDLKFKIGEDDEGNDINEEIKDCYSYNGSELQFVLFGCIPHLIKENEEQQTALEKHSKVINTLLERIEVLENK
jgi:hypothetical protein